MLKKESQRRKGTLWGVEIAANPLDVPYTIIMQLIGIVVNELI